MDRDEELMKRLDNKIQDIKFTKELQWRNVYWAVLINAAIIALFQMEIFSNSSTPLAIRWIGVILVVCASVALTYYQCDHKKALDRYRSKIGIIEHMLTNRLSEVIDLRYSRLAKKQNRNGILCRFRKWMRLHILSKLRKKDNGLRELMYFTTYVITIWIAAIITIIIILADPRIKWMQLILKLDP